MITLTKKMGGDIIFIDLSGEINVNSHDEIQSSLVDDPDDGGGNILMNCENLTNISSSGIGILVTACMEIHKQGRIIKLVKISPGILEKLDLHKVIPVFSIFSDVESAAKQIKIDVDEKGKSYVRLFERIDINLSSKFRIHKKGKRASVSPFQDATAMNLTKRGMFIKTDYHISPDTLIDVKLSLGGGFFKKESVVFLGKVVRRVEGMEGFDTGLGLIILHMDVKDIECLDNFLKKQ